jgi:hypothetical protein
MTLEQLIERLNELPKSALTAGIDVNIGGDEITDYEVTDVYYMGGWVVIVLEEEEV